MNLKLTADNEKVVLERYAPAGYKKLDLLELIELQKSMELLDAFVLYKYDKCCYIPSWLIYHNSIKNMDRNLNALNRLKDYIEQMRERIKNDKSITFSFSNRYRYLYGLYDPFNCFRGKPYLSADEIRYYWQSYVSEYASKENREWHKLLNN